MYIGFKLPEPWASRYHITLSFNGHDETRNEYKRAVCAAARTALYSKPFVAMLSGDLEAFGPLKDTWVTLVDSPGLHTVHTWLEVFMAENAVQFSKDFDYRPHVTMTKFKRPKKGLTGELLIDRLHVVSTEHGVTEVFL